MFFNFNCLNIITNNFRARKVWWLLKKIALLTGVGFIGWGSFVVGTAIEKNHSISKLPNSCFVDAVTYASNADLILSNNKSWAHVYIFTFHYRDDLLKTNITLDEKTKEFTITLPKIYGHAVCVFEYGGMLWIYDNNWGSIPVGNLGNRNEYEARITKYMEEKYRVVVLKSLLLDDDERTQSYFQDKL